MILLHILHENEHLLLEIAHKLLEEGLVYDAKIIEGVQRLRLDNKRLAGRSEYFMICKTRAMLYPTIQDKFVHEWQTDPPLELYAIPVTDSLPGLRAAVFENTRQGSENKNAPAKGSEALDI
ncbi:MAG: hypothetical protein LPK28_02285 [Bacteroidota bacterium]|nr:hypothetical protein [Bacteroidota bacterium]